MFLYRVFPYAPNATVGSCGHATYLHRPQGMGRLDNPGCYAVWYLACEPSGAVGETFGDLDEWSDSMLPFPKIPGSRRALATYSFPDDLQLLEMDSAQNLLDRGMRPTQVIERNRSATQAWALRIYRERNDRGESLWQGVRWWSYHRPQWRIQGYWGSRTPNLVSVEPLNMQHPALVDAATALRKIIV